MRDKEIYSTIKIRRRTWYMWLLRLLWFIWLAFWAEVSIGSLKETEPRAFSIALIIFLLSLTVGVFIWIWSNSKAKKREKYSRV